MNKSIFLSLLLLLGAQANSFFGIPILGEPKDQLHAIIYQLIEGLFEGTCLSSTVEKIISEELDLLLRLGILRFRVRIVRLKWSQNVVGVRGA